MKVILLGIMFFNLAAEAKSLKRELRSFLKEKDFFSRTNLNKLLKGETIAKSKVDSYEIKNAKGQKVDQQKMKTKVAAFHSSKCGPVLKKFSQYEAYDTYFDFVKNSKYQNGHATMRMSISLIRVNFGVDMQIKRVTKPGIYNFVLTAGQMKNTIGQLEIYEKQDRCLLYTNIDYDGIHSGYWDSFMETFFIKVADLGVARIFKLSGHKIAR